MISTITMKLISIMTVTAIDDKENDIDITDAVKTALLMILISTMTTTLTALVHKCH